MRLANNWRCSPRRATLYLGLAGVLAVAGCGDGKIGRYPVTGKIHVDGRPAEGALVIFCPVDPSPELENLRPAGKADAMGEFNLITFESGDGAPAGNYKVLVQWPVPRRPTPEEEQEGRIPAGGPDRLKGRYYNLNTTPFTATIEKQSNELAPFELKSK